jgi:hypothetical protein
VFSTPEIKNETKNRGGAADFFLKGQDNSWWGFIFCHFFAFPGFQCFVRGARTQKGQVSGRGLLDRSNIACTGTQTKMHWVFQ